MKQEYFVVVLAHSLRGRLRRIHIPHTAIYAVLALALVGCFSAFGFVASYGRMAWKVANYNALKREADEIRTRYQTLQKVVRETDVQIASLQLYAKEVAVAFGIKQKLEGPPDISAEGKLVPSFTESLQDDSYLFQSPEELTDSTHKLDERKTMINVGSVGQPRDGNWRSCYVLLHDTQLTFRRVEYDIDTTVRKIHDIPELDNFLGDRLRDGR